MMIEELGLLPTNGSAVKDAFVTFLSFIIFGIVPSLFLFYSSITFHCWSYSRYSEWSIHRINSPHSIHILCIGFH